MNADASTPQPRIPVDDSRWLYLTGGRQRSYVETDEWQQYGHGIIARVDTETGAAELCVEYVSPADVRPNARSSITFKSASVAGGRLYVCTSTEVLVYALPDFELAGYVSIPCFNDLHHVCPTASGTMIVANTGLDMVLETTAEGRVTREWDVLGRNTWEHFSPEVDYRKVPTTKPHKSHPNHVFGIGDGLWVTRFEQRDAVRLNGNGSSGDEGRIPIDIQSPHDGTPFGGFVYFTTVDGHLVVVNAETRRTEQIVDLNPADGAGSLGWCRGLRVVEPTKVWVGFSGFRPTRFLENVSWVKSGFRRRRKPTHLALYDLVTRERLREIEVESLGMHTIFSLVGAADAHRVPSDGVAV